MITLNNINYNIKNRTLFSNARMVILNDEITVLFGESGSGKSTLLNILASELPIQEGCYIFNSIPVNELTNEEKLKLRKNHILYIRQDDDFIKRYTLKENAILLLETRNQTFDLDTFKNLLNTVGINENKINKPLANLSNGERQRFAVVCATMIDADLYIFDEPTSSLDLDNSKKIVKLIEKIASKGKMVVVSMHNEQLFENGHFYTIEDQMIKEVKESILSETRNVDSFTLKNDFMNSKLIKKEGINLFSHFPFFNTLLILVLSFVVALSSVFASYGHQLVPTQKDLLEGLYDNELFLVNYTDPVSNYDYDNDFFLSISDDKVNEIKNIEHVVNVYPHQYLKLQTVYYTDENLKPNIINSDEYKKITLLENGNEITSKLYDSDLLMTYLEIDPVYPHHRIKERCVHYDDSIQEGFYISSYLAQKLGINKLEGQSLKFYMSIPVASNPAIGYDKQNNPTILARGKVCVLKELEFPIKGILKNTSMNYYTVGTPNIFLDYDSIQNIIDNANEENKEWIEIAADQDMPDDVLRNFFSKQLIEEKWNPSAYIIEIDNLDYVDEVRSNLQKIDEHFYIRGFKVNGQMTQDIVDQQKTIFYGFSGAIIVVLWIASFIIGYFKKKRNAHYYHFLSHIGFDLKSIHKVQAIDCLILVILIIPFMAVFSILIDRLLSLNISFDLYYMVISLLQCIAVYLLMKRNYIEK